MFDAYDNVTARLRASGDYIWPLLLRLIMFWEFWEAGIKKLNGDNWFADIPWADWQKGFSLPFSLVPPELNWLAATWGGACILRTDSAGVVYPFRSFIPDCHHCGSYRRRALARRVEFPDWTLGRLRHHGKGRRQL